jgi:hypothetical protein
MTIIFTLKNFIMIKAQKVTYWIHHLDFIQDAFWVGFSIETNAKFGVAR